MVGVDLNGCTDVTIPDSVTSIGDFAFYDCSGLTSVKIPNGVTYIGASAFEGCLSLREVNISDSVEYIDAAFWDCNEALYDTTTISGVKLVDGWVVKADSTATGVVNLAGARGICEEGLNGGVNITKLILPATLLHVCGGVFWECEKLTEIEVAPENPNYKSIDGALYSKDGKTFVACPTAATSMRIADGVETIAEVSFDSCGCLATVVFPDSVTMIGEMAFFECDNLKSVTFLGNAPTVDYWAFEGVSSECVARIPRGNATYDVVDGKWEGLMVEYYDVGVPGAPAITGDEGATVTGDAESGWTVMSSATIGTVEVSIPDGVDAGKVTVEVASTVESVKANGATVKVVKGGHDITPFLDIPAAEGTQFIASATVKEEIVKEALDTAKGAEIVLDAAAPTLTTAPTKPGLTYTLREGTTLKNMSDGDSTVGDGEKWTPTVTVKGGASGFYSIGVGK